jgi:hypothetical protein
MGQKAFNLVALFVATSAVLEPIASASKGSGGVAVQMARLPLRFEANHGQWDPKVAFLARGAGYDLFLTPEAATLALHARKDEHKKSAAVSMHVLGGRASMPVAEETQPGRTNYFFGNDPARWRTNVEGYGRVAYRGVRPGVDLVFYGNGQRALEYDVVVAPGVAPETITLGFDGADHLKIDESGALVLTVGGSELLQPVPVAYQTERDGSRTAVAASYDLHPGGVGFTLGHYDRERPVVIDPSLSYSTYLGGSDNDFGVGLAVDASGYAYVTGKTKSSDFPTAPTFGTSLNAGWDVYVTKLAANGGSLVYSTYLGGSGDDEAEGIVVDASGNAYITGDTTSTNFPTTANTLQPANVGLTDAFVTKLSASGAMLLFSTYLGGSDVDYGVGIAVDLLGSVYVAGTTHSANFPTVNAFQGSKAAGYDAFVAKLAGTGAFLVYSTFVGGDLDDYCYSIALTDAPAAWIAGETQSTDFPTRGAYQNVNAGGPQNYDAFVTGLSKGGTDLTYSTYLGGSNGDETGGNVAVDSSGNVYLAGTTTSTNFPTLNAHQPSNAGGSDGFVAKFSTSSLTLSLIFSTYIGGSGNDGAGVTLDPSGNVYVTGSTNSTNFPITAGAFQVTNAGGFDAYVAMLTGSNGAPLYSTYLGGAKDESVGRLIVDASGTAYLSGSTQSNNYPITTGAFQVSKPGALGTVDAFVTKMAIPAPPPPPRIPAVGPATMGLLVLVLLGLGTWQARGSAARNWARSRQPIDPDCRR